MDWKALFKGVVPSMVSRAIWWLLVLAAGAALGIIKLHWPSLADPMLYGLAGAACVAFLYFAATGRALLARPDTTPGNVEKNIRTWLDNFGLAVKKEVDPTMYFRLTVTLVNGNPLLVARPKARDHYLTFQSNLTLSPEHQAMMERMSGAQTERVLEELALELGRLQIGHAIQWPPFTGVMLIRLVPITADYTEAKFAASLDEMDLAINVARTATSLAIARNAPPLPLPS